MPTRYTYNSTLGQSVTELRCGTCDTHASYVGGRYDSVTGDELDIASGRAVTDLFRFVSGRGRFTTSCRQCERTARQRAGRTASSRVPGTAGAVRRGRRNAERKFGVELELRFPNSVSRETIVNALAAVGIQCRSGYAPSPSAPTWSVKSDGSIRGHGFEVVTPPLAGEAGLEELRKGMRALRAIGAKVDTSTGTHVHHDVSDLRTDAIKRFYRSWFNSQKITDGLVAPSRRGVASPYYCQSLTSSDVATVEAARDLRHVGLSRYKTVNIASYGRYGTIEIRQHQGTCDFEKVKSWILLGQALLDDARAQTEPRPAATNVLDFVNRLGALLDETAKTFAIGHAVEFAFAPLGTPVAAAA